MTSTLKAGDRLGAYEVLSPLGAGGMGEVYRARDTKLNRDVALKVLLPEVAHDADRLARFGREAQVLASLNHPNIGAIYGLEQSNGVTALVLELVEGPTLADLLAGSGFSALGSGGAKAESRKPKAIPIADALKMAAQIASALEAAHEQGIIHRDLKPANIKVRDDGTVKVLDFGLAKAMDPAGAGTASASMSPTLSVHATQAGLILGSAAYMAPEQAKGRAVDRRADVWAFGAVLYEILAGRRAFDGEDVSDTLANVLKLEPDWTRLPEHVPARVRQVIRACLQKDRRQRIGDMQDVRLALDGAFETAGPAERATPLQSRRREYAWAAIAFALLVVASILAWRVLLAPSPRGATVRFDVSLPEGVRRDGPGIISPDGTRIAYTATVESRTLLWVHSLDGASAQALAGTEEASRPFWSPGSQRIAFFAQGRLKTIPATGGPVQNVCILSSTATHNGTWNQDDVILFAANDRGPILRVPASGGQPVPVLELDTSAGEVRHAYPNFLPDGRHFLFMAYAADRSTHIGTLDSSERRAVPGILSETKYSPTGHLLFIHDGALVAQSFDPDRLALSGDVVQIADQVGGGPFGPFSVSANGDIVFGLPLPVRTLVASFDRTGRQIVSTGPGAEYRNPMLSPNGKLLAFERGSPTRGDILVMDLDRGVANPFATHASGEFAPVWSPDGRTIAFVSERDGERNLYERAYGATGDDRLILKVGNPNTTTMDWSSDGRYIVYGRGLDIWALPRFGDQQPVQITEGPASELQARLSPDGRWIAYTSSESGSFEVFVQSFPKPDFRAQVSTAGGFTPRWKPDGRELYYVTPTGMLMAVPITLGNDSFEARPSVPLFASELQALTAVDPRIRGAYDVAANGSFLMAVGPPSPMSVILNWSPSGNASMR